MRSGKRNAFYGTGGFDVPFFASQKADQNSAQLRKSGWRPVDGSFNQWWVNEDGQVSRAEDILKNWSQTHDQDILDRQSENLTSDGNEATLPDREKSASVEEVMRLRQSRDKGQKFQRSDAKVRNVPLNAQTRQGDLPEGEGIEQWNKNRKL